MNKTACLILASFLLAGCGREAEPPAPTPAVKGSPEAGKALAGSKCINCHGLDGKSTGPDIPHLAGQKLDYLRLALKEYRTGHRPHAALQQLFSELTEAELDDVAAYYASLPRILPAGTTPAMPVAARDPVAEGKAASTACAACHGADGNSTTPGTPSLAGQHRGYLIASMQAYKEGSRKDPIMGAQMAGLDLVAMQNIASYYASQPAKVRAKPAAGDAATGERLSAKCGGCHGLQGHTIDARTSALAGQDAQYLVKSMQAYRDGTRKHAEMQAMLAGLKDQDLEHIAAFYAVQKPKADRSPGALTAQEWASRCDRCHAPTAENPSMIVPHIEAQRVEYLARVLKAYRDDKRHQSAMHAMGMPLSDTDIQAIAEYYAALPPR